MDIKDVIELTRAGFTKDEILGLMRVSSSHNTTPEQTGAEGAAPVSAPEPVKEEQPAVKEPDIKMEDIGSMVSQKIEEAFKPFENLYNQIAIKAQMPTIGNIQPKGIADIIRGFYE